MSNKVTVGKPKVGGAIYVAPAGTTLPTDATSALTSAFVNLGNVSEDGVSNDNSKTSTDIKNWEGSTVLTPLTEVNDKFTFTLLDVLDENVLKEIYGTSNVALTNPTEGQSQLQAGIRVDATPDAYSSRVWVIEMVMTDGVAVRKIIPNGTISALKEITYKATEAVGFEITVNAAPSTVEISGSNKTVTHIDYMKKSA